MKSVGNYYVISIPIPGMNSVAVRRLHSLPNGYNID